MPASFSISPIVEDDIPGICAVSGAAFANDRHTLLKAAHPTRPYDHAGGMGEGVKYWLSLPKENILPMKAVDDATGRVIAFGVWGLRLNPPQPQPSSVKKPSSSVGQDYVRSFSVAEPCYSPKQFTLNDWGGGEGHANAP